MVQVLLLVFTVGLFTILTGIIWMITRHSFDDDLRSGDVRQSGNSLSESRDKGEPHELSSRHSKVAV
jgi:hypothetical protein